MGEREMRRSRIMDDIHTTLTLSFFLFIAFPHSHSQPSPPLCAHPSSLLSCYGRYEYQNFTVKDIDDTTHTMTVVPTDSAKNVCSPNFFPSYENLNKTLSQYYALVHNVTVFSDGCPSHIPKFPSERRFNCGDAVYYFEGGWEDEILNNYPLLMDCKRRLRLPSAAPLDHYGHSDDGAGVLEEALSYGFGVYYGVPQVCRRCSCGSDGYDEDVVSCQYYCSDQHHCSAPKTNDKLENRKKLIILGVAGSVIAGVLIIISILCVRYKSPTWLANFGLTPKSNQNIEAFLKIHGSLALKRYTLSQVKQMTKNFKTKLGQGGFGTVYKGKLFNGSPIAVKMLSASKKNGEEFINEIASISRTSHVNVVLLLGFCLEGRKRALIYEFMPNGSLDKFIYRKRFSPLSWDIIYQIAKDIARGLEYLHKGCNTQIVHFDIKPHNILLDENFYAKISDFGLAKLCPRNESIISLSDARGTMGYVAPEMWSKNLGSVSHKSDIYSYRMMLLEMVGGRKNINAEASHTSEIYFPHWAYNKLELDNDLRPDMVMTIEENEIAKRLAIVGFWCTQTFPNDRPTTSRVIDMLEGNMDSLQIPPKPLLSSPTRSVPEYSIS